MDEGGGNSTPVNSTDTDYCCVGFANNADFAGSTAGIPGEANPWTQKEGKVVEVVCPGITCQMCVSAELYCTGEVTYSRLRSVPCLEPNMHGS